MVYVGVVEMPRNEVVDVVAMGHGLVTAPLTMDMVLSVVGAAV